MTIICQELFFWFISVSLGLISGDLICFFKCVIFLVSYYGLLFFVGISAFDESLHAPKFFDLLFCRENSLYSAQPEILEIASAFSGDASSLCLKKFSNFFSRALAGVAL